jgi:hypothetical protein
MTSAFRIRPRPRHCPSARLGSPQPVEWRRKTAVPPKIQPTEAEGWDAFEQAVIPKDDDAAEKW